MDKRFIKQAFVGLFVTLLVVSGCSTGSGPADPRAAVISMFGAMEKNDKPALAHLLDLAELMKASQEDYALKTDQPRQFSSPEDILEDLTGEGKTKKRWFALQRIVSDVEVNGDQAEVEVTFVDKDESKGYRTKFGLHIVNDRWKIYTFKTIP